MILVLAIYGCVSRITQPVSSQPATQHRKRVRLKNVVFLSIWTCLTSGGAGAILNSAPS